jgi:hypothetical protein
MLIELRDPTAPRLISRPRPINPYLELKHPGDLPRELERLAYRVAGLYYTYQGATLARVTNMRNPATQTWLSQAKRKLDDYLEIPEAGQLFIMMQAKR